MKIRNKIFKESLLYSLSGIITQFINLITLIILMKYISKEDLGLYFYIIEFIAMFAILAENGFRSYYTREISQSNNKISLFKDLQFAQINVLWLIYLSTIFIAYFITKDNLMLIAIVGLAVSMVNFFTPINAYVIAEGHKKIIFYKDIFIALLRLIYFQVAISNNMSMEYFLYFPFFQFIFLLLFWTIIKKRILSFLFSVNIDFNKSYLLIKHGFSFTLLVAINLLYNKIDILMLESMKGYIEVANYTSATKFLYPLMFFSFAFMIVVFPKLSKGHNDAEEFNVIQYHAMQLIGILGLVLVIFTYFAINYFYNYFFDTDFDASILIYKVLLPYIPIVFLYGIITNAIVAKHDTNFLLKINSLFLVLNIVLNVYFIKYYSSLGAAISTIICEILIFLVVYIYGLKKYNFKYPNTLIFNIFLIIILYYIYLYRTT